MLKSYSHLELESAWRKRILELVGTGSNAPQSLQIEEPEDKLLPRIGLLYGVLRRMYFSEDIVRQAILASKKLDIEEVFEWVC
jgi:hypothetical protein